MTVFMQWTQPTHKISFPNRYEGLVIKANRVIWEWKEAEHVVQRKLIAVVIVYCTVNYHLIDSFGSIYLLRLILRHRRFPLRHRGCVRDIHKRYLFVAFLIISELHRNNSRLRQNKDSLETKRDLSAGNVLANSDPDGQRWVDRPTKDW